MPCNIIDEGIAAENRPVESVLGRSLGEFIENTKQILG